MGITSSDPARWMPVEAISGNRLILEPEHGAIHDGQHFVASHAETVGTATAVTVMIQTPSAPRYIHFICDVESDKAVTWTFSEAPNASGGSAIVSLNNYRGNAKTAGTTITSAVTYTSAGTILDRFLIGTSGNPNSATGGAVGHRNEWLLAANTSYLVRVVAAAATTQVIVRLPYYYRETS